ncbi:MAG TPA: PQQ-binding-like beta-propeller repeat protein [Vicinamibacterales bacterium]|nr:PQQ-binding-like beta-propeller repeat protein [Vicinamibacterales bacterium]
MKPILFAATVFVVGTVSLTGQSASTDWPQWRGPDRNGLSKETGLLSQWPRSGPPVVWSAAMLGAGYGSIAVQRDRVYVQGMRNRQSVVSTLNRADGKLMWVRILGPAGENDRGPGPRSTPTIDGDRVYALSETGDLACLRAADGTVIWQRNILKEFKGENPYWLLSESPLIDGDHVIVTPGGRGAGVVALDKMSGKTIWVSKELSDGAGYASPIVADVGGVRTIMNFTADAAVGVRAVDGKLMWRNSSPSNGTANIATPVYSDGKVFFTSSYGTGGALLGLRASGNEVRAQEIYFTRDMKNHHGGVVLVNGYIYGYNDSILTCLEFASGKMVWRDRSVGKGAVTYADGHLYILSENNVVGLVEATPAGYREKGRFSIADQGLPSWAHPVVSGGRLYIRNQGTLTSYDVRAR